MEQEQEPIELEGDIVQINIRLEKKVLKIIDLIYESDRKRYISRERTIEHLIKKGMHQTF